MRYPSNLELDFYELSHTIKDGILTYKGLPPPSISDFWSRESSKEFYDGDTSFHIGQIEMVANTGTYIDSPFHRFEQGSDLSDLDLKSLANLDGLVIRADYHDGRLISEKHFQDLDLQGKAVLINTNWDEFWGREAYFEGHPFITRSAAELLAESGASLVGIDSYNIDDTQDGLRPAHTILLRANIPIVEHLTGLKALPENQFRFFAVPVKIKGLGSFPVRAFAISFTGYIIDSDA